MASKAANQPLQPKNLEPGRGLPGGPRPGTAQVPGLGGSRGLARQERSRATVAAILEAAARLLVESGFRAASTNAIARRAGVSVGSLYQYFASREDVFHALVDQHREAMHALVGEALEAIEAGAAPAPTLSALLERMIAIHRTAPDLMHAMQTQLNHLETEAERQREAAAMETMVVRMARLLPVPEPEARARIWLAAEMLATLARRLGHRPPDCASLPAIQAVLAEQLGHLLPPGQGRSTTLAHASHRF